MADGQAQKHLLFRMQIAAITRNNRQETGVRNFPEYGFCNDKTLSDPLVCVLHWESCVGSHERISGSAHEHVNAPVICILGPHLRNGRG